MKQKPPTTLNTRCQEVQEQPDQTTSKQQPPFSEMSTTPFLPPCIKYIRRCWCQCKLPTLVDTHRGHEMPACGIPGDGQTMSKGCQQLKEQPDQTKEPYPMRCPQCPATATLTLQPAADKLPSLLCRTLVSVQRPTHVGTRCACCARL